MRPGHENDCASANFLWGLLVLGKSMRSLGLAALALLALISLTGLRLESQGVFYDELHQAPAAFRYIGSHPFMFTWPHRGIPLLNMTYVGAIKSNVYGLYLRYVNPHFTIATWRFLGIAFVAIGLFVFVVVAGRLLPLDAAILFLFLFLSDISVIVMTRHDWGPTALAQTLRLLFLSLWLLTALDRPSAFKLGLAGFLVGISIWEKLSSVVLLAPLCILLFMASGRSKKDWLAAAIGLFAGTLPLLVANMTTYMSDQGFISIGLTDSPPRYSDSLTIQGLARHAYGFVSLGQGRLVRQLVLGEESDNFIERAEVALIGLLMIAACLAARRAGRFHRFAPLVIAMVGTYILTAAGLAALPSRTHIHHWIIGTPFQYAAIALTLSVLDRRSVLYKWVLAASVLVIVMRVPTIINVERSFFSGKSSARFDPAFNRLFQLAATRSADSAFIATDWGSATQIYCGTNGNDGSVYELYENKNPDQAVIDIAAKTKKQFLYLVTTGMAKSGASSAILTAMESAPGWSIVTVESEFASLGPVRIRKFVKY